MNIRDFKLFRDKNYIDGKWITADSGDTISVNNPANLKEIGTVPKCCLLYTSDAADEE